MFKNSGNSFDMPTRSQIARISHGIMQKMKHGEPLTENDQRFVDEMVLQAKAAGYDLSGDDEIENNWSDAARAESLRVRRANAARRRSEEAAARIEGAVPIGYHEGRESSGVSGGISEERGQELMALERGMGAVYRGSPDAPFVRYDTTSDDGMSRAEFNALVEMLALDYSVDVMPVRRSSGNLGETGTRTSYQGGGLRRDSIGMARDAVIRLEGMSRGSRSDLWHEIGHAMSPELTRDDFDSPSESVHGGREELIAIIVGQSVLPVESENRQVADFMREYGPFADFVDDPDWDDRERAREMLRTVAEWREELHDRTSETAIALDEFQRLIDEYRLENRWFSGRQKDFVMNSEAGLEMSDVDAVLYAVKELAAKLATGEPLAEEEEKLFEIMAADWE